MIFKQHRLAVILWETRGKAFQVNLSRNESIAVSDLLRQMHGGTVKVLPRRLALSLSRGKHQRANNK